jgi:hypothetical protein
MVIWITGSADVSVPKSFSANRTDIISNKVSSDWSEKTLVR